MDTVLHSNTMNNTENTNVFNEKEKLMETEEESKNEKEVCDVPGLTAMEGSIPESAHITAAAVQSSENDNSVTDNVQTQSSENGGDVNAKTVQSSESDDYVADDVQTKISQEESRNVNVEGTMEMPSKETFEELFKDTLPIEEELRDFLGFEDGVQKKKYSLENDDGEENATILMEKEKSLVSMSDLEIDKENKEYTGEGTTMHLEKETSSVLESEVDGRSQTNISMDQQNNGVESAIPMEKETCSVSEPEMGGRFQTKLWRTLCLMDEQNKGSETANYMEKETSLVSRSEVNSRSQANISMEQPNKGEETAVPMEIETSSDSESEVDSRARNIIYLGEQNKGEDITILAEIPASSISTLKMDSQSNTKMSMNEHNKEDQEVSIEVCHFYNRDINGCNTSAEECNWLHVCATCSDEHPVRVCKMQKEKENLKKKLFRRGRRGGRNSCEKRDIDICYYYNRNLNGCKDEKCKLSHECFCCGEGHPIIVCDLLKVENTYRQKCYNFNRGLLGCKEKNCEKFHCCFVCSKDHPIKSCNMKEQRGIAPVDGKSDIKKTAQAFDIPYNFSVRSSSHDNDGPLCYAYNEGPNGCTEPEGTCKSVHACYTCGENHPVSSCKQTPNKSATKITKRKGKTKAEKIAQKIEEKKEVAKQIEEQNELAVLKLEEKINAKKQEEKKELAVLKLEEKIKLKKANSTPKHPLITLKPKTQKADDKLAKPVTKHKPISPPRSNTDIRISREICRYFNNAGCRNANCPWLHGCTFCKGNHPVDKCMNKRKKKVDYCTYFNSYFNNGFNGCRNTDICPFVHACNSCGDDHPAAWCDSKNESPKSQTYKDIAEENKLAKNVSSKADYCQFFNNQNGCSKSKEICPLIHACFSCNGKHPVTDCDQEQAPSNSSVLHRNYNEISVTIKSYKGSNVKKISRSSSHEQYESGYPTANYEDSLMEHSGMIPSKPVEVEYEHYGKYRSSRSEHFEKEAYHIQSSRARSREREPSVERGYMRHYRSRSRERRISPEIKHLQRYRADSRERQLSREQELLRLQRSNSRERQLSRERELLRLQRSNSRERDLSRERNQLRHHISERIRHRSRSLERADLHTRMSTRELRSRSRERYQPHSRERSMSSAERMMSYQVQRSKAGRAMASPLRDRRSRSREKDSGLSSTSGYNYTSRSLKHVAKEPSEHHIMRESHSTSFNPPSSRGRMSTSDAVETCIILSNFCSDLGLLGPTLEEVCKRALSDKENIAFFFKDTEVRETMELVSLKLEKLKSKSSNELHKEKYRMGLAKIEKLLEA